MAVHVVGAAPRRDRISTWANDNLKWLFIAPAALFVVGMIVVPVLYTINLSLTDAAGSVTRDTHYTGIDNYVALLTDTDRFWPSVWRTFYFSGSAVLLELVLGLAIALLLRKTFSGERWVRSVVLLPLVATPVAVGMAWLLIFEPTIGFANTFVGWFGIPPQQWIASTSQAMPSLIAVDVWQWTPMMALILLAGLVILPQEPYEAAMVDGANAWQRFRHITLPMLAPALVTAVLLRSIDGLKTFDILYATKGKGGGSSHEVETLNIYAYDLSFDYNDYGKASALLMVFFVLILFIVFLMIKTRDRWGANL